MLIGFGFRKSEQMQFMVFAQPFGKIKNLEFITSVRRVWHTVGKEENLQSFWISDDKFKGKDGLIKQTRVKNNFRYSFSLSL